MQILSQDSDIILYFLRRGVTKSYTLMKGVGQNSTKPYQGGGGGVKIPFFTRTGREEKFRMTNLEWGVYFFSVTNLVRTF